MDLIAEYIFREGIRNRERLKDILIDQVFDYCFNEKVAVMESNGDKISAPSFDDIPKEERLLFSQQFPRKRYYANRKVEYCQVIFKDQGVHPKLMEKLLFLGYEKGSKLQREIESANKFLIIRSYFSENNPNKNEVKLTQKGFQHYMDGKSFEDNFILRRNSNWAIFISIISLVLSMMASFSSLPR